MGKKRVFDFPKGYENLVEDTTGEIWYCSSEDERKKFDAIEDFYRNSEVAVPNDETISVLKFESSDGTNFSVTNYSPFSISVNQIKMSGYWMS